jgi:MFS family permease
MPRLKERHALWQTVTTMQTKSTTTQIQNRLTGTLFASESLFAAAQIGALTLVPVVAAELSGQDLLAGLPHTAMLAGQAAAAYFIGSLMDRIGRRSGLAMGYLLATLGAVIAAVAITWSAFAALCLGAGMIGMGRGAGLQARFAAAEIQPPDRQARAIGIIVFAGTIGAVVGPLLVIPSQHWAEVFGFNLRTGPYLAAALLFYGAVMITFFLLRPDPMTVRNPLAVPRANRADAPPGEKESLRQIFAPSSVRLALAAMLVGQLVMVLIMVTTPLYMNRQAYSDSAISIVMAGHTLGMFGLAALTGWLIDQVGRQRMIAAGAVVLIISAVMAPVAASLPLLVAALFLLGLGWNFCFIAGSSLLSTSLGDQARGRAQGANDMLVAVAAGTGSFSTGPLFALGGITLICALGVLISAGLLGSALLMERRTLVPAPAGD